MTKQNRKDYAEIEPKQENKKKQRSYKPLRETLHTFAAHGWISSITGGLIVTLLWTGVNAYMNSPQRAVILIASGLTVFIWSLALVVYFHYAPLSHSPLEVTQEDQPQDPAPINSNVHKPNSQSPEQPKKDLLQKSEQPSKPFNPDENYIFSFDVVESSNNQIVMDVWYYYNGAFGPPEDVMVDAEFSRADGTMIQVTADYHLEIARSKAMLRLTFAHKLEPSQPVFRTTRVRFCMYHVIKRQIYCTDPFKFTKTWKLEANKQ